MGTQHRRGANAIEFALVLPFLLVVFVGVMDYGYFFRQQWFAMDATREAVRWGTAQAPAENDAPGTCPACVSATKVRAKALFDDYGIPTGTLDLTPSIVPVEGTCALSLRPRIPHAPLLGLVPLPSHYTVDALWLLDAVEDCS